VRVAHAAGIVHRDLKPANLFLVQRRGQSALLKILDFGIAKATRGIVANDTTHGHALARPVGVTQLTGYGGMLGSARYMAPEQMESARDVDGRADIWAIGVIGYKLLTGEAPFHADTHEELFVAMLTRPFAPLAARRPDAPPALVAAIEGCLRPAREDRWPTVDALAATLTRASPVHRSTPAVRPSARRGPAAPLAAPFSSAGFGLALLAVGAAIAVAASGAAVVVLLLLVVLPALFPASAATSSGSGVGAAKDPLELLPQAKAAAMARMPGVSLVAIKITSHATAPFRVEDGLPQFFFGRAGTTVWTLVSFDSLGMHVSDFTSPSALPASIEPRCSFEAAKRSAVAAGHVPAAVELDNYGSSARNAWTFQAVGGGAIGPIFEVDGATCAVKRK
jgi:hypothetical protein